ncbi:MAG: ABC transporter ATP-binding protein [Candidatus Acidiferrales bacterium]
METGELVGLVGPNGAGKTTLIKILATLQPADSGSAAAANFNVSTAPASVRASVGYLPDVPGVYQDTRVDEFLEFFADAFRLKEPRRSAAIERALGRSGLEDRKHDYVEQLSLGWKQRLLLAKILLHEPKVLLLYEPATGLDPLARLNLREQLKQLRAEGITVLISSHILADLEDICTRVVFIADGKNVNDAQPATAAGEALPATLRCQIDFQGAAVATDSVIARTAGAKVLERKDGRLVVELQAGATQASAFLRDLLGAGLTVVHFDARGPGLEERYRRAFADRPS